MEERGVEAKQETDRVWQWKVNDGELLRLLHVPR